MATAPALDTQARVIIALALREVHTLYGGKSLGYLWAIFQTAFGVAVFWAVRYLSHAAAPHGMTVLTYLVAGFGIWNIINQSLGKCMAAIDGNRALLTFPQVTPLDIMLARCLVVSSTQVVSMTIILGCGMLFGYTLQIADLGMLIYTIFLASFLGLGLGATLGSLAFYIPALQQVVPMIMRLLFFASGIFYSVSAFSHRVGDFLMLNPIMQLIELARTALSYSYTSPYADIWYVSQVTLGSLFLGMLLERYVRRKVTQ
ncbi:ABC transporter permease [uncultured Desulfovibrio sp.]|uniref:ABC transporter permease n=1 Tax=uncultured Desulfovibrio sp. TaxID=167968 RepID=UPI002628FE5D|nr:ABC transporter permease [uncultured Desulfovibrio sp.]